MFRRRLFTLLLLVSVAVPWSARAAIEKIEGYVTSSDGTKIHYFLFLPEGASASNPAPLVLRTHGWGGSGESSPTGDTISALLGDGYAVLTWDQRGFGRSGGQAEIDSPQFEGRDVGALLDLAQARPDIKKVGTDPVVGMTGGSYAGGIQFSAASVDSRIDAIAPEIAWYDLPDALFPSNIAKLGWDTLLYGVAHTGYRGYVESQTFLATRSDGTPMIGTMNPTIHESFVRTLATNDPSPYHAFYDAHSVRNYLPAVNTPALIIEGITDTLFPINHGIYNAAALGARGVPTKLLLFNGGHTIGSSVPGGDDQRARIDAAILNWFAKYLRGQAVDTGAPVEYQDQFAAWHSAASWPAATGSVPFSGSASNLVATPAPTGGGGIANGNPDQSTGSARIDILTASQNTEIIGVPHIAGTVGGVGAEAFLFFKLVDADAGVVLSDQVTPLRVGLLSPLSQPVPFSIDLNGVSYILPSGHHLALEISTGSLMYANSRTAAVVNVSVSGTVPTK